MRYDTRVIGSDDEGYPMLCDLLIPPDYFSHAELEALNDVRRLRRQIKDKQSEFDEADEILRAIQVRATLRQISLSYSEAETVAPRGRGRPADPGIATRRRLVRQHITRKRDWQSEDKVKGLFEDFDRHGVPMLKESDGGVWHRGTWAEAYDELGEEYFDNVIQVLNRDRWRR
jgi:hypothetical protein